MGKRTRYLEKNLETLWVLGEWLALSRVSFDEVGTHKNKVRSLLLLLHAHAQLRNIAKVKEIIALLIKDGVSAIKIARHLTSSCFNTLGKMQFIAGNPIEGMNYFEAAISYGMPGAYVEAYASARSVEQLKQVGYKKLYFRECEENEDKIVIEKGLHYDLAIAEEKTLSDVAGAQAIYASILKSTSSRASYLMRKVVGCRYKQKLGYWPDTDNPKTLNEKIHWRKFHQHYPYMPSLVDKVTSKKYASRKCPDLYVIKVQDVAKSFDDLSFSPPCLIKLTADSGGLWVVNDELGGNDKISMNEEISNRLKKPYGLEKGEWVYRQIDNQVFAEDLYPYDLVDFSFYCFHGSVEFILKTNYILENNKKIKRSISYLDKEFKKIEKIISANGLPNDDFIDEYGRDLLSLGQGYAESLSENIDFARVDLFLDVINKRWIFGEITFYPVAGLLAYDPNIVDEEFGALWKVGNVLPSTKF